MKLVVFGLTITSSWGNGHATLWRGLCRALTGMNHRIVFFERDQPYYADARDRLEIDGLDVVIYEDWRDIAARAARELRDCDAAIVTSYCADPISAGETIFQSGAVSVFYDLDTPVTLAALKSVRPSYIGARGLADFDLALSYSGGPSLQRMREELGARRVATIYGHADPSVYAPTEGDDACSADLSYLGTYAADRQPILQRLFLDVAADEPDMRFVIAGSQYPGDFAWARNIHYVRHMPPAQHATFFCSARLQLNITRADMASCGYCPSGRIFEATACGAPVITDFWPGLSQFFEPGVEILLAHSTQDVRDALGRNDIELKRIGAAGRARTLSTHTSAHRARTLLAALDCARGRSAPQLEEV